MRGTQYCSRHPSTETNLGCGKCETPICPQCMVFTPVGARCPDCAHRKLPTFDVGSPDLAKAIGTSLAIGIGGGVLFALLSPLFVGFFILDILAFVGLGYAIGEGVSASVNRKRGRSLRYVAGGGVVAALVTMLFIVGLWSPLTTLIGVAAGIYTATGPFKG